MKKLILNMIVKNEAKIILRCLDSIYGLIDGVVICDTGSTDDTIKIITDWCQDYEIPLTLKLIKFENFGQARNEALTLAKKEYPNEYLLLLDAGMEFKLTDVVHFADMRAVSTVVPHTSIHRKIGGVSFANTHIVSCEDAVKWEGVCHEFLVTKSPPTTISENYCYIQCHQDGGNQEGQAERYLQMLQTAYDNGDRSPRTVFYLAQSYRETNQYEKAVAHYRERISIGQFDEEVWYSKWKLAWCKWALGHDVQEVYEAYVSAWMHRLWRLEPVKDLVDFLHKNLPTPYTRIAVLEHLLENPPYPAGDLLFIEKGVYKQ